MSETRQEIRDYIYSHPGVHFSGLQHALDIAPGQVQHHVRRLTQDDEAVREHVFGKTHYYPPEYNSWERQTLALLRRETAGDIVSTLFDGPQRPQDVADSLGIARSTLEWHLERLEECDVVQKDKDARGRVRLELEQPIKTAQLIRQADPSLLERLVDRFTRLIDQLLEDSSESVSE